MRLSECRMHPQKSVSMMTKRDLTAGTKCHASYALGRYIEITQCIKLSI